MPRHRVALSILLAASTLMAPGAQAEDPILTGLASLYPSLDTLYRDLHRHPELSLREKETSRKLAVLLSEAGYEVTERVGGYGIVGVMKNGTGPTVLIRTDMDALPVREQTGLPFASTVVVKNDAGDDVGVMHACGHDIHMTSWIGAARLLARQRDRWHGTLVFVGQPAEESLEGAEAMLRDGLLTRFPRPDFAIGIHDIHVLPAGQIGVTAGPAYAASTAVDVTFHGKGGHGAMPHMTIDPILIAARTVVTLQSIVSREVNPFDPAVVTVGTFHAGTRRNIIPDDAKIELTVRSFKPEVQKHLLASIERIARAEAAAAGASRPSDVEVAVSNGGEVVVNDSTLAARLLGSLRRGYGEGNVVPAPPTSASEDFGAFGRAAGIPSVMLWVGAIEPAEFARAAATGATVPGPHNAKFAPDRERTIRAGVAAFALSVLELLNPGRSMQK
jgi:amidohydrolase